ncbi:MAG: carboxypeptidase regulatory-like domain-containing protein [Gammaproteobacteria bacterium]|nr:carboxypeptidase regulatory-like domain-containing protein [Gammaproteobacteria bacterium]
MRNLVRACVWFMSTVSVYPALAATLIQGQIVDEKQAPLHGVLVRVTDHRTGISESIYSRGDGSFALETSMQGEVEIRSRTPYFRDSKFKVSLNGEEPNLVDITMYKMTDAQEISDSLPAAYHFGNLPFEEGDDSFFTKYQFQRDCLTCHQMGNPLTRVARSPRDWVGVIIRMHAMLGNFDAELRDRRSELLSEGFDGAPLAVRPEFPLSEDLERAKIYEYRMERGVVPHDAIYNPTDGLLYTVDQAADHMAITDIGTGQTKYVSQSGGGMVHHVFGSVGGELAVFNGRNGPHSLDMGPDGKYYVTNTSTNSIGVFSPETHEWEPSFVIGGGAIYPHTIRFDLSGRAWFTLAGSESLGNLDPETGKTGVIRLPRVRPDGMSGGTTPYGIDTDPITGMVWYTRLFGDRIGKIDPGTDEVTEFESPIRGPRRMRFDASGTLWVTGYSEGMLAKIDPATFESTVYPMPEFAAGYRPAPYALGVHPQTQDIWVNENMTDRMYRFIPDEERWVVYPIPLSGTYTRDMTFTDDGKACTSNNPVPPAALEGGVLQIICIDANAYQLGS